jgi:hypothetical protein
MTWLLSLVTIINLWFVGEGWRAGAWIGLYGQLLWAYFCVTTGQ